MDRIIVDRDDPKKNVKMSTMIWYLGTKSIQEVPSIDSKTDSTRTSITVSVKYYLFIDSDLHTYIYFSTFSDTATIINYSKETKLFNKYGGWDPYPAKSFDYDSYVKITDTILNGISYNRHRFRKIIDGKKNDYIIYTCCKNKNAPIKYLRPVSEQIGCPVVRMEMYFNHKLTGTTEFHYLTDTLTDAEVKVFKIDNKTF